MGNETKRIRLGVGKKKESKTDRQERIEGWQQDVLRQARVLVVGAGATGNELLKNLALLGVGYVLVCDMDHVDNSNLSRTVLFREEDLNQKKAVVAARRFQEINVEPAARADYFVGNVCSELGAGVWNHIDVVVSCLDNMQARYEASRRCTLVGKPFIDAGILELEANVSCFLADEKSPCWGCMYSEKVASQTRSMQRDSCDVHKREAWSTGHVPTTQVASALAAALQSQEVVKCLHHRKAGTMDWIPGRCYRFNGTYNSFDTMQVMRRESCRDHVRLHTVEQTAFSCDTPLVRVLDYVCAKYGSDYFLNTEGDYSYRGYGFITKAKCRCCGKPLILNRPGEQIAFDDLFCPDCPRESNGLSEGWENELLKFSLKDTPPDVLELPLRSLGIPPMHLLQFDSVEPDRPSIGVELTANLEKLMPSLPKEQ